MQMIFDDYTALNSLLPFTLWYNSRVLARKKLRGGGFEIKSICVVLTHYLDHIKENLLKKEGC